jgi:putative sigma-54 modulation protein
MRIDVTGKHVDLTPPMVAYAQTKCEKITKFFDGLQQIRCVLDKGSNHHAQAEYTVEIIADVVGHDDFIANSRGHDIYACIDEASDKVGRSLREFKERLREKR